MHWVEPEIPSLVKFDIVWYGDLNGLVKAYFFRWQGWRATIWAVGNYSLNSVEFQPMLQIF